MMSSDLIEESCVIRFFEDRVTGIKELLISVDTPFIRVGLTTSRTEALQTRRSCASSLETFTQPFLHHTQLKTRCP